MKQNILTHILMLVLLSICFCACTPASSSDSAENTQLPFPPAPEFPLSPADSPIAPGMGSYDLDKSILVFDRKQLFSRDRPYTLALNYADFNKDGLLDVILASGTGKNEGVPILIYQGDSTGQFRNATEDIIPGEIPQTIHARKALVADFNGDSDPDVYIADHGYDAAPFTGAPNVLLLSDGDGHLKVPDGFQEPWGFNHCASAADIDQDGDVDIFVGDNGQKGSYFLINDSNGYFTADTAGIPASLSQQAVFVCELIDVDDDGSVDLLIGRHEHQPPYDTIIFWGKGDGTFEKNYLIIPPVYHYSIIVDFDAEDLDGDRDKDILIERSAPPDNNYTGFYFQLLMQQEQRTFTDESFDRIILDQDNWLGCGSNWLDWIRLVDMDNDDDFDILPDDELTKYPFWENDGSGYFSTPLLSTQNCTNQFPPAGSSAAAIEDQPIYNDNLANGWSLDPWGGSADLNTSEIVYQGGTAIKVDLDPNGAITFDGGLSTELLSRYTHLVFYINGGQTADQQLYVEVKSEDNIVLGESVVISDYLDGAPIQPGKWYQVMIPFSVLTPQALPFAWFDIGDASGNGASTFYIDDIRLIAAQP